MKNLLHRNLALLACSAWCALSLTLPAQVPNLVSHQGRVAVNGVNFDGNGQFKFALVNANGSTTYWSNDGTSTAGSQPSAAVSLPVTKGLYSVMLGDTSSPNMSALPASVFSNADLRLRVWFNNGTLGFQQLSPDQRIAPNGYLPDGSIASSKLADGAVTSAKLAAGAVSQLGASDGSPSAALKVDANGLVGIGSNAPKAGLDISTGRAIQVAELLSARVDGRDGYSYLQGANSVAISGNLMAITAWTERSLTLIDISNPANPVQKFQTSGSDPGSGFLFDGIFAVAMKPNLVAVAARNSNAVTLLDVTNPSSPIKRAELRQGENGYNRLTLAGLLAISGNLLVVAPHGSNALTFVDITDLSAPVRLLELVNGTFGLTKLEFLHSIAISGNLLAAGGESGTVLMDISVPTAPVLRAELPIDAAGLTLRNNILAIADSGQNQVTLLDVTNPAAPATRAVLIEGTSSQALFQASSVAIEGNRMAVGTDGENAVSIWDISNPTAPVELAVARQGMVGFGYLNRPRSVALSGGIVAALSSTPGAVSLLSLKDQSAALTSAGWVGIGVAKPDAALHVAGDFLVQDANHIGLDTLQFQAGRNTSAMGRGATALGYGSIADGEGSTAMGFGSQVRGAYATASGISSAFGDYSVAMGAATARPASVAIGYGAQATGDSSLALGRFAKSESQGSTAIGLQASATGVNGVSIGTDTRAQGNGSAAIGTRATAAHDRSFVWSDGRDAQAFSSTAVDQFLIRANGGVGINTNNPGGAALAVNGNITFSGSLTGSGAGLTNLNPASLTGTVSEAQLPANVALRSGGNAFTGNQSIIGNVGIGTNAPGQMLQVGDANTPHSQGMMRFASRSGTGPSSRYWDIGVPQAGENFSGKNYSFVIDDPTSGGDPEMTIRWDSGNVGIGTANPTAKLDVNGSYLRVVGGGNEQVYIGGDGLGGDIEIGSRNAAINTVGFWNSSSFQHMHVVAQSFNPTSDRNLKENFAPVDTQEVLEKVSAMPISRWNFIGDAETAHIGPMAQDFHAAFATGTDDKHIATVDADGVALAAIQGLNEKLRDKESEIAALKNETSALREKNQAMEARLAALEELLSRQLSASTKSNSNPSAP